MKILHIINSLQADGGAENLLFDITTLQKNTGDRVKVVVFIYDQPNVSYLYTKAKTAGIDVIFLKQNAKYSLINLFDLRKVLVQEKPDIIHSHLFPSQYISVLATIGLKFKLITTEHSSWNTRRKIAWLKPLEQFIYNKYYKIICISEEAKNSLVKHIGNKIEDRCVIIENGINLSKFEEVCKYDLSFSCNQLINIVMIARFSPDFAKDHTTVVKALLHLPENIQVTFIGDGALRAETEKLVDTLGLTSRVIFFGVRDNIPALLSKFNIGILSSNWEGLPLSIIELMAAGLPVIVSDIPGLRHIVEGYGLLFEKGDALDLAEKIKSLINNKKLYQQIKQQCINRAQDFDIRHTVTKYNELYLNLIGQI